MAGGATGMYFLRSGVSWGIPGGGIIKLSSCKISKLKKCGLGGLMRKGTGGNFIGTSTRFYGGGDMGTPATDLHFLRSRARLRPPGGELSNYQIIR